MDVSCAQSEQFQKAVGNLAVLFTLPEVYVEKVQDAVCQSLYAIFSPKPDNNTRVSKLILTMTARKFLFCRGMLDSAEGRQTNTSKQRDFLNP